MNNRKIRDEKFLVSRRNKALSRLELVTKTFSWSSHRCCRETSISWIERSSTLSPGATGISWPVTIVKNLLPTALVPSAQGRSNSKPNRPNTGTTRAIFEDDER